MLKKPRLVYSPEKWRFPFAVVLFAEMVTLIGFQTSISIIPFFLQENLNVTGDRSLKFWISILATLPGFAMAIFSPIWGGMADKFGRRIMLLRAMFGGAVIIFLMTFVTHPGQLLVLRVLQGCLTGSVAAATVLVASLVPRSATGFALGLLQVGIYIGSAVGPALGGFLFNLLGGRGNFLATSILLLTASFITFLFVPEPAGGSKATIVTDEVNRKKLIDFSPLKENPTLIFLILLVFFGQTAFNMVSSIMGVFIQLISPGITIANAAAATGVVLMCSAASAALGAVFFGFLGKRFNYHILLIISFVGAALCYIPQGLSHHWHFLLIFRIIDSFFVGGVMPGINTMLAFNSDKRKQGAVFGLSSAFSATGSALGPALGGFIAQLRHGVSGYRLSFFVSSLLLIVLTVTLFRRHRGEKAA
jgi:DHA1 family multidrug resistance protein-like MFS transporter